MDLKIPWIVSADFDVGKGQQSLYLVAEVGVRHGGVNGYEVLFIWLRFFMYPSIIFFGSISNNSA